MAAGRLHEIEEACGDQVTVEYKVFPLGPTREEIEGMFGSTERAKCEIQGHWAAAIDMDPWCLKPRVARIVDEGCVRVAQ